ncbi:MAG TPA: pseudouridine synthase [Bryobacterales bacterium]|nr:pseudouridine synthase [Bryobacterales bacterium]
MQQRLQKIIANAGITSRRKAEELITQGRVIVNDEIVTKLGAKADLEKDTIKINGQKLGAVSGPRVYLMLNKPRGCISSTSDPEGRQTVMSLLGRYRTKVYPVGRLDYASEGLLLFTNDGDFANHVLSAKSEIPKTYKVKIKGNPTLEEIERFRRGIPLNGRPTAPARIQRIRTGENPWFEVVLTEGRNQQIRNMFRHLGYLVEKIKRVKVGTLSLGALPAGKHRLLTEREVERLLDPSKHEPRSRPRSKRS